MTLALRPAQPDLQRWSVSCFLTSTRRRAVMKAAVLVELNRPLEVCDIEIPKRDVGQVLVQIASSGICGKQIDEITGRRPDPYLPHLLGHEGGGIVLEVGPGVRKVKPGDHVVLHWI